jgi:hypothetical protein
MAINNLYFSLNNYRYTICLLVAFQLTRIREYLIPTPITSFYNAERKNPVHQVAMLYQRLSLRLLLLRESSSIE